MMAELYGRANGYCRGKGGSMHIADFSVGMLGANGVVAGGIPIAVGAAQGLKMQKSDAIVTCMFGDGAINRGPFLEGLNWAVLFKLRFFRVRGQWRCGVHARRKRHCGARGGRSRQGARCRCDHRRRQQRDRGGRRRAQFAVAAVRRGEGPHLLHVRTYRITGHTSTDAAAWRPAEEVAEARSRDPIARLGAVLAGRGVGPTELGKMIDEAKAEMAAARKERMRPPGRRRGGLRGRAGYGGGSVVEVTLIEASRRAALQEMRRDERVWVLGEDVARGGLWGQYKDFLGEFGAERVVSTPISKSTIMGAGLGSALVGMRPIIEMRIFDFVMCAMDELVNQIAKVRYMFGGQAKPAVVVRMPHGMWRNSAAQHSQMLEAWFAHLPGVVVVTPSTPADTAGLLVQAIRSDDPVLFFDPKDLFGVEGEIADPIEPIPFGVARKVVDGDAATVCHGPPRCRSPPGAARCWGPKGSRSICSTCARSGHGTRTP